MPRKLKFHQPKNYERRKTHKRKELSFVISIRLKDVRVLPLSIPRQLIQTPQLTLSLPISAFVTAPVTDLYHLNTRLSMQSLPDGWIRHMNASHNGLIFSSLSIDSFALLPITTFIVKIDCDLKWSLSYNGIKVKNQQLSSFSGSQQIKCLNDVLLLLTSIQASRICCGNPVEEFKQLLDDRGGELKDSEGCSNSYICICISIVVSF